MVQAMAAEPRGAAGAVAVGVAFPTIVAQEMCVLVA